ncbi:hypothetical protein KCU90_g7141, partial [Aureobasidium melanogenum]
MVEVRIFRERRFHLPAEASPGNRHGLQGLVGASEMRAKGRRADPELAADRVDFFEDMRGRPIVGEEQFACAPELKQAFVTLTKAQMDQVANRRRPHFMGDRDTRGGTHGFEENREPVQFPLGVAIQPTARANARGEAFLVAIHQNKQDHLHHGEKPGVLLNLDGKNAPVQALPGVK